MDITPSPALPGSHPAALGESSSRSGLSRSIRLLVMCPKGGTIEMGPDWDPQLSLLAGRTLQIQLGFRALSQMQSQQLTSSLLCSFVAHIQIASSLQQALWALSPWLALR